MGSGSMGWHPNSPKDRMDSVLPFLINLVFDLKRDAFGKIQDNPELCIFYKDIYKWNNDIKETIEKIINE